MGRRITMYKEGTAKSVCHCGHLGDGTGSAHSAHFQPGHGRCNVPGCPCDKFRWDRFTPEYEEHLAWMKSVGR